MSGDRTWAPIWVVAERRHDGWLIVDDKTRQTVAIAKSLEKFEPRVIAAAPMLLKACEAVEEWWLEQGLADSRKIGDIGAPFCIFAVRHAIDVAKHGEGPLADNEMGVTPTLECDEMTWLDIETAPRDGRVVRLKRVYEGSVIAEGDGVFDFLHEDAPARKPLEPDPLGRESAADYALLAAVALAGAETKKWLRVGRMYRFPTPTHWKPLAPPPGVR